MFSIRFLGKSLFFLIAFHFLWFVEIVVFFLCWLKRKKFNTSHLIILVKMPEQKKTCYTIEIGNQEWKIAVKAHLIGLSNSSVLFLLLLPLLPLPLAHVENGHFSLFHFILRSNSVFIRQTTSVSFESQFHSKTDSFQMNRRNLGNVLLLFIYLFFFSSTFWLFVNCESEWNKLMANCPFSVLLLLYFVVHMMRE